MNPKLRVLEFIPFSEEGEEWLFVRDPQGFCPGAKLPREWGPLLARFDGEHTIEAILAACGLDGEHHSWLHQLVNDLDDMFILDSPRFRNHQRKIVDDYNAASTRPAELAGSSYPAEPAALRRKLKSYFTAASHLNAPPPVYAPDKLRGIIVPHIDFNRGGTTEALAYETLKQAEFDLLITFGIAHQGVRYPYCAATKDFQTPLGTQRTDVAFIAELQSRVGERLTAEQWAHKSEHSVEFVAVFLQACSEFKNTKFVPIICGGFFDELRESTSPSENPNLKSFALALRELVEERRARGERVGFIASVDLAHVGPNFDHPYPVTALRKKAIERADREMLGFLEKGDVEGFHDSLAIDANARHVDAHPAVYTIMHAFPGLRAQLLHYAQAPAPQDSVVSFASMALHEGN